MSCKDLGQGDCQGWLYQRKEQHRFLSHTSRWTKRWVVLKTNYLYCYKNQSEAKAECLIHLPGFTVAPALESKSKKYAFKLFNPSTAFHFACETHSDMSAWMSKMGLAAISYMTPTALLPEAFYYSETDDSEDNVSPVNKQNKYVSSAKANSVGSHREQSPAALSTSSSDTTNSIRDEIYGRSRMASSSSTSTTTSNSSTFHDIRSQLKPSFKVSQNPYQTKSIGSPSPIPHSPLNQPRMGYLRSASSLDANEVIAARNRHQMLSDTSNTRYAKIVFPQSQSPKGSFSPQIAPRRLRIPYSQTPDSNSLDRQRLNFLKEIASGNTQKLADTFNGTKEDKIDCDVRQTQAPRPLPRKSITRRDTALPAIISNMADTYEQLNKSPETRIPSVPNTPPTRPAVPKPDKSVTRDKTGVRTEQNSDDTYEYVFRPTMAMIKTGIVNPLYERVPNNTWSGERTPNGPNATGKSRMPLPSEMRPDIHQLVPREQKPVQTDNRSNEELSFLDREYNRLYGMKKPNERLSPKTPLPPYVPKSAPTAEIENIYLSKPRTTSASSIGHFDDSSPQLTPAHYRDRPNTPSSSDNSMSSSSGISSYYSTYLEIPAQQMHRMQNHKRQTASTSSYHSAKSSPLQSTDVSHNRAFDFSEAAVGLKKTPPEDVSPNDSSSKAAKGQKSSFRLFSSPKLLKKLSTPKYHKERHLEKKDVKDVTSKVLASDATEVARPSPKTSRLFLGSPKLTRALFGSGSSKKSPPLQHSLPLTPKTTPQETSRSAEKAVNTFKSCDLTSNHLNRSSSDSSVQSGAGTQHKSHHITEKRLTKPELTIQLPLLTESSTDSSELPLTPETPRKPTMGVAMIGKKRRPSNVSTDRSDIESALNQYYGCPASGRSSRSPYTTEDTDDEWASIVRTIEGAGRALDADRPVAAERTNKTIDDEKLCHLVLSLRAVQRKLKVWQLSMSSLLF